MGRFSAWLKEDRNKVTLLILVTAVCLALELVVHLVIGVNVVYTHFFYVVLVMAGIWFCRRAVWLAMCLGGSHVAVSIYLNEGITASLVRAVMLIVVTYIVGSLAAEKREYEQDLVASREETEQKRSALVAYISECTIRLKSPVELVRENLAGIISRLETGSIEEGEMKMALAVQIGHADQISANLHDLNEAIIAEQQDIPDAYRKFLMR
jgi:hypothetical protein